MWEVSLKYLSNYCDMKSGKYKVFALIGAAMAIAIGERGNKEMAVQAYALIDDNYYSTTPVKVYVEKSGLLRLAHLADNPDIVYPVYETEVGQYRYYFTVKGHDTITYCFNY